MRAAALEPILIILAGNKSKEANEKPGDCLVEGESEMFWRRIWSCADWRGGGGNILGEWEMGASGGGIVEPEAVPTFPGLERA